MPGPYVDTKSSLVLVKHFSYRGNTQPWSNRYHTNGPLTITLAEFEVLADAVVAAEKLLYTGAMTIVQAIWNDATDATSTNPHGTATHTKNYATAGTFDSTGGRANPGDAAFMIQWLTDARTVHTNHPIYLRKYYHGPFSDSGGNADNLIASQVSVMNTFGTHWLTGFSDGTNTHLLCSPRGAVAQSRTSSTVVRHRDFPT